MTLHFRIEWSKFRILLFSPLLSLFLMNGVQTQAQDPRQVDIQQMKDKLQSLEQSMQNLQQLQQTIEELKAQISALETKSALDNQVASLKAIAPPASNVKSASVGVASIKKTSTTTSPKQEPQQPQDEAKQTMEHEITPAAPGTFDMYGFAMLDAGYNFGQIDPNWFDVMRPTKLPAFENEFGPSGNVFFSVRQTRWG